MAVPLQQPCLQHQLKAHRHGIPAINGPFLNRRRRIVGVHAGEEKTANSQLESLDAMLGQPDDNLLSPEQQLVPWWQLKPKQSAPPRQTLMHPPGQVARFVADQAIYSSKVRSGRSTAIGGELDIPQVDPYFCYLVVAMQLAVYAAGTWLAVTHGPEAAEQWAVALSLQPQEVLSHGEDWRLATSLLLHGGIAHLTVDTAFLGWFGPGIEALLGHGVFLYIYLLSGLAGSAAVMLLSDGDAPTACATAASVGLVGAMVGYELRNQQIVKQSIKSRRSKAEDGRQGSSTLRKPFGAFGIVCVMLALGFIPGSMVDNTAHVGGLLAGVGLGYTLGPNFTTIQEVDIPEGSMMVPEDAVETVVVLDRRSSLDRVFMGAAALGLLAAVVSFGSYYAH